MNDTIYRQAAIDAVYEAFCYAYCDNCEKNMDEDLCGDCHRKYQNWSASKKTIEKVINNLPSAETDIIQCRNCKFASGDSRICMKFGHSPIGELDFCAWAERRTDG